ncbi:MAG: hypothetical protein KGZ60_03495 [Truepera sp.]|nr:hypothetical protein [Truepera sp.]
MVRLPSEGRYALWVVDSGFALRTETEIPLAELWEGATATLVFNPTAFIAGHPSLTPGYILFTPNPFAEPGPAERQAVAERFAPYQVIFDDRSLLKAPEQPDIAGLYLIENGVVRHRYLLPAFWQTQELDELILRNAQAFLAGSDAVVSPMPLRTPGTRVDDDLALTQRGHLLLKLSGLLAQAPSGSLRIEVERNPDGSFRASTAADHPYAERRFVMEAVTPYLQRYGVQGVGLVLSNHQEIPELGQQFPDWLFVALDTPEARLRWLEIKVAAIVDAGGVVRMPFLLTGSLQPRGLEELERLLREVGGAGAGALGTLKVVQEAPRRCREPLAEHKGPRNADNWSDVATMGGASIPTAFSLSCTGTLRFAGVDAMPISLSASLKCGRWACR